ncbi:MAG: hypothetical protein V3V08_12145 [Nannocystaceae bacterium]
MITAELCDVVGDEDGDGLADKDDPDCWRCGDGVIDPNEECDDQNQDDTDLCSSDCVVICAADDDGDGRCDIGEDNCIGVYNPDQDDEDGDDVGDACDICEDTGPDMLVCATLPAYYFADTTGDGVMETDDEANVCAALMSCPDYTVVNLGGCNCTQIYEQLGLPPILAGFGCRFDMLDDWIDSL